MKFLSAFEIPLPIDEAWKLLLDVPAIVPCVPGAALTDDLGDGRYRGTATVKIGPVELTFSGEATTNSVDAAARTAAVTVKGMDKKGRGNAAAKVGFTLTPLAGDGTGRGEDRPPTDRAGRPVWACRGAGEIRCRRDHTAVCRES